MMTSRLGNWLLLTVLLMASWSCAFAGNPGSAGQSAAPAAQTKTHNETETQTDETASTEPAAAETLHRGIDVSAHSGTVDWSKVAAAGHTFAFVKATEGMDLLDPAFAANWQGMKSAGIVRGAYHFFVTEDDPDQQAKFFIETVQLEPGDLAPVVDIELIGHDTPPGLPDRLQRFLKLIQRHYGVTPIIYTSPNFWNEHIGGDFETYPLWVAEYDVEQPRLPKDWESWFLWQWQADAEVPGVPNGADLSRLHPQLEDLSRLLVGR